MGKRSSYGNGDGSHRIQARVGVEDSGNGSKLKPIINQDVLEVINDAIFVHDSKTGAILEWNQRMCDLLGYSPEEMPNVDVGMFSSGAPQYTLQDALILFASLEPGESRTVEWHSKHKSSRLFWAEVSLKRAVIDDRDVIITVARDISARKSAEDSLRESQYFSQSVIDTTPDIVYILDLEEHRNIYSNHEMVSVLGYTPEQVIQMGNKLMEMILHPDDAAKVAEHHAQMIHAGDEVHEITYRMKDSEGKWRWLKSRERAFLRNPDGTVKQMIGIASDFTQQKTAEESLRQAHKFSDTVLNTTHALVIVMSKDRKIVQFNPSCEQLTGWRAEEVLGKDFLEVLVPEYQRDGVRTVFENLSAGMFPAHHENEWLARNGSSRWITWANSAMLDAEGEVEFVVGTGIDITERKKAEQILKDREDLLRQAQSQTRLGYYIFDIEAGFWTSSEMLDVIFGIDADYDRTVSGWLGIVYPDDRDEMSAYFQNYVLGERKKFDKEYRIARASDKAVRWVHGLGELDLDSQGNPIRVFGTIQDITERVEASESNRKKTEELDRVFNLSADMICIADSEARFVKVNPAWETSLGYTAAELEGISYLDFIHPDDVQQTIEAGSQLADGKEVIDFTNRYRAKDSTYHWIEWRSRPFEDGFIYAIARDVTERVKQEEALRQSEERFRIIATNTPDHILVQDRDLRYLSVVNPQLGLTDSEYIGRTDYDILKPEDAEQLTEIKRRVIENEETIQLTVPLLSKDGEIEYFEGSYVPKFDSEGNCDGLVGYFRNITASKRAEQALIESEERYRVIAENSTDFVATHAADGTWQYVSPSVRVLLGFEPEELIGRNPYDYIHPDDISAVADTHTQHADKEKILTTRFRLRRKNGNYIWCETTTRSVPDESGNVAEIHSSTRDISERISIENDLIDSEKRYRGVVELIPAGVLVLIDDKIAYANPYIAEITKSDSTKAMIGKPIYDFIEPHHHEFYRHRYERILAGEAQVELAQGRIVDTQGNVLDIEGVSSAIVFDRKPAILSLFRDISERKIAEEALKQSQSRLQVIFDKAGVGITEIDANNHFVAVNGQFCELLGYSRDELIGKSPQEITAAEDLGITEEALLGLLHGNFDRLQYEKRYIRKDGSVVWASVTVLALRDTNGKYMGCIGTTENITERKTAETALKDSEAKFSSLFASTIEGIALHKVIYDDNGQPINYVLLDVNPAYELNTGLKREDAVGKLATDIYGTPEAPYLDIFIKPVITGEPIVFETYFPPMDKHFHIGVFSPGKDMFATAFMDITQRKLQEVELAASEEKYRAIYECSPVGIFQSIPEGQFLNVSPSLIEMFGYDSLEDLTSHIKSIGRTLYVHPEWRTDFVNRAIAADGFVRFDNEYYRKDGSIMYANLYLRAVKKNGTVEYLEGFVEDITDRHKKEEALRLHAAVTDTVGEGLFIIGVEDNIIKWTNHKFEEMFGYEPGEMVGMNVDRVNAPTDEHTPTETRISIVDVLLEQGSWHGEVENIKKDGTHFWCYIHVTLFDHPEFGRVMVSAHTDITDRVKSEQDKRIFYRDTILSATNGKLDVCENTDVAPFINQAQCRISIASAADVGVARHQIEKTLNNIGVDETRLGSYVIAVGEALTNAIKHADGGNAYAGYDDEEAWVVVEDTGRGIDSLILPGAVLRQGFSTKPSMGLGYSIMLDSADHILLKTDSSGTTVVLVIERQPKELSLSNLPDTWENITF